jgi:preprotein translocase subunit SecE
VAEKTVKTKQPENKPVQQKVTRAVEKEREKPKKQSAIAVWWRETVGELRKVSWPSVMDARRLTGIVLVVMVLMSVLLGTLDWVFSQLIALLLS